MISPTKGAGNLQIVFPGEWHLTDTKVSLYINNMLHSKQSIKQGFLVTVPVSNPMSIKLSVYGGLRSITYNLSDLTASNNYTLTLKYSRDKGWFKKEYDLQDGQVNAKEFETTSSISQEESKKKGKGILYAVILLIILIVGGVLSQESAGTYFGRYDYEPSKDSYSGGSNNNAYFELYENNEIRYHSEASYTGVINRWGQYSVNNDKSAINVVFNDGAPEMGTLILEEVNGNWRIQAGESIYQKNKKFHENNFKKPMR